MAEAAPGKTALVAGGTRMTFAELDARVNRAARALARRGAGPGQRIAVALANRPEFFEVAAAAGRIGAEVVPVPWRAKAAEIRYIAEDSRACVLVAEDDARERTAGLPAVHLGGEYEALRDREEPVPMPEAYDPAPVVFRYYTSGTTGRPKAVERSGAGPDAALRSALDLAAFWGVDGPEDVHLLCGPLYHTAPCAYANYALLLGQTIAIMERFDAASCLELIERERVTWAHMVPINFVRILGLPERDRAGRDLSSIRRIIHAAAPCPVEVKRAIMRLFPENTVWEYYGMTEGFATVISPEQWLHKPGSVGRPAWETGVTVRDGDGRERPAGEAGLIYVRPRGGARFVYAGDPAKTAESWLGDEFTVGDMGYLDSDGYLFLTDRAQDLIITGGANVYPAEVEAALYEHPAVADVAVIGVPDDEWGESVHALVEPRSPVDPDLLIAFCRERLAHYKCPRTVELVGTLARDENGKIRKRELRERYWTGHARRI